MGSFDEPLVLLRMRRGVGAIFALAGLLHAAEMTLAALYALRRLHLEITARLWSQLYYAHFLFLVLSCAIFLALSYRREGTFLFEPLLDFLVGVGGFIVLLSVAAVVLVRGLVSPWLCLAPSAFLLAYGIGLWKGRPFGFA